MVTAALVLRIIYQYNNYRPLAGGVSVSIVELAAAILEYNVWVLSMSHENGEHVCSSSAVNQFE